MSVLAVTNRLQESLRTVGKVNLHANHPNDFELYLVAFELLNWEGRSLRYFIFPVNPSGIKYNSTYGTNIQKTAGGVGIISDPTFIPQDYSLNGTFGRKLRIVIGSKGDSLAGRDTVYHYADHGKTSNFNLKQFDPHVKTGYGCMKIVENIFDEAKVLDRGKPRTLILYNLAYGHSFVVKVENFTADQTQETNMLWQYSIKLKTVAPADAFVEMNSKKLQQLGLHQYGQNRANDVNKFINKFINTEDAFRNAKLFNTPEARSVLSKLSKIGQKNLSPAGGPFIQAGTFFGG